GQLLDIYYQSVGRNANLLLNVPVDRDGLIHPADSTRLMELRAVLDETFDENLAAGAAVTFETKAEAGNGNRSLKMLTDDDFDTFWAAGETITSASLII